MRLAFKYLLTRKIRERLKSQSHFRQISPYTKEADSETSFDGETTEGEEEVEEITKSENMNKRASQIKSAFAQRRSKSFALTKANSLGVIDEARADPAATAL